MERVNQILKRLESLGSRKNVEGMARYGIRSKKAFGVSAPKLRAMAKAIGRDHALAQRLWKTGVLDARALAALVDDPAKVTQQQMERWVRDFDNWAVCDTCCGRLFDKTPFAWKKAVEWSKRKEEYVKRAGYALMAWLAVHDKQADDNRFMKFLPHIKRGATDERNFVKKAVNWGLRQIGKRNLNLNGHAIRTAKEIDRIDSSAAKWVAGDALRELAGRAVPERLRKKKLS
jgi:3-methyladenine DNA glycosylase AlkD